MQLLTAVRAPVPVLPRGPFPANAATCPAAMARHLRRTEPEAARCFAQAMHDDAAWANEAWGAFWADVVRLVS